ncbi:MAG: hypothetical protein ACXWJM_07780 [Ramlibacter sp.]
MKKSNAYLSVLMAGLVAAAGAYAQTTPASGSSDTPPKAGEASTQTMGAPNAKTTNSPVSEAPAPSAAPAATTYSAPAPVAQTTTNVTTTAAMGAGLAADAPKTRAQVKQELLSRRAMFEAERKALKGTHNTHYVSG